MPSSVDNNSQGYAETLSRSVLSANRKHLTILVVDDEPAMLDAVSLYFQEDHTIIGVESREQAIKVFPAYDFDAVISDLKIGTSSGAELLTELRALRPECVRILMTGFVDTNTLINAINEAGISYYLTKPIDLVQLRIIIERIIDMSTLQNANVNLLEQLREQNMSLEKLVQLRSIELQRANDNLRLAQQSREQVVRMAVHDLQNPLNNIDAILKELTKILEPTPDVKDLLDIAQASSASMRSLVEDMLTIAVLTKTDTKLRKDFIEIGSLLRSSARAFSSLAEQKNIWLNVVLNNSIQQIIGDSFQLRKVVDNLVSNAIKYTPQGGSVTLTATTNENTLTLDITDTGLGMTEKDIASAFQEFTRLSAQPTAGETSTGLGLYIVKKIVELHKGTVSVQSNGHGSGTTFTVALPLFG